MSRKHYHGHSSLKCRKPPTWGKIWPQRIFQVPRGNPRKWGRKSEKYFKCTKGCGLSFLHRRPSGEKVTRENFNREKAKIHIHDHRAQQMKPKWTSPRRSRSSPSSWSTGHQLGALRAETPSLRPVGRTPPRLCHCACSP